MSNNLYLDLSALDPTCEYPYVIITDGYLYNELRHHMKNNTEEYGQRDSDYYLNISFPSTNSMMRTLNRFYSGSLMDIHDYLAKEFDPSSKKYNPMAVIAFKKSESAVLFKLKDLL